MNQRIQMAKKLFALIEKNELQAAEQLLSENFVFSGPVPEPMDSKQWLDIHQKLNVAFPDFSFNATNFQYHGIHVHCHTQISGTHKNDLDLSNLWLSNYPATATKVVLPEEYAVIEFDGDKISAVKVEIVPGGGLHGILSQIGVAVQVA